MTARQVGRHSVYKHINIGRINSNHVIEPNVVNGTSYPKATRHRVESVTYIKCCLISTRSIVDKNNILWSMLLEGAIDICAITETWIISEEETTIQTRLVPSGYVIKSSPRPIGVEAMHSVSKTTVKKQSTCIPSSQWNAPHRS